MTKKNKKKKDKKRTKKVVIVRLATARLLDQFLTLLVSFPAITEDTQGRLDWSDPERRPGRIRIEQEHFLRLFDERRELREFKVVFEELLEKFLDQLKENREVSRCIEAFAGSLQNDLRFRFTAIILTGKTGNLGIGEAGYLIPLTAILQLIGGVFLDETFETVPVWKADLATFQQQLLGFWEGTR